MIASSDRSSSPSLPLYLCLHTVLPSPPLSIFCFPVYFTTNPCYKSPALLSFFYIILFTSTIIPSPPVPSLSSSSFLSCRELQCVFVFASRRVTDWFALCWFWWRGDAAVLNAGTGKVKGSTSAVVNWQHVDQTGLNQNHSQHPVLMSTRHPARPLFISVVNLLSLKIVR